MTGGLPWNVPLGLMNALRPMLRSMAPVVERRAVDLGGDDRSAFVADPVSCETSSLRVDTGRIGSSLGPNALDLERKASMSKFTTFYEWLEKQKGKKSPLGTLANGVVRDEAFPKDVTSLEALLAYMKTKDFSGLEVATARIAWQSYARGQAPSRPI